MGEQHSRNRREFVRSGAALGLLATASAARAAAEPDPTQPAPAPGRFDYDTIVIGSGFGGAVVACRLAEAGHRVLILERGRRWQVDKDWSGPDDFFWKHENPLEHNGWIEFRSFGRVSTVAGAGVGGGSLHYANVSIDAPPDAFDAEWPSPINHAEMAPYYAKVKDMLKGRPVPPNQVSKRAELMKRGAEALGYGSQFSLVDVAVNFDESYAWDSSKVPNPNDIVYRPNAEGVLQGTCVHLGDCVIGCKARARNTLEMNYIPRAEKHGAEVRPLHLARKVAPEGGGYRVFFDEIRGDRFVKGSQSARLVVVSAGSVGSTELLLHCRDEHGTLKGLGKALGTRFATNTNYLTVAKHPGSAVFPTRGVTIESAIGFFGAQKHQGQGVNIEDGGVPDLVRALLQFRDPADDDSVTKKAVLGLVQKTLGLDPSLKDSMFWFSQGRDASVGRFSLKRRFLFFGERHMQLDWDPQGADATTNAIMDLHRRLALATGGEEPPPSLWPLLKNALTPHPLGGCPMADSIERGVVNHLGETFGYRNLFVADASVIPRAIGLNPTKTIAALAERTAAAIVREGR